MLRLVFALLFASLCSAAASEQSKASRLRDLLRQSSRYTIHLDREQFEEFVESKPRPYTAVIFFYNNTDSGHLESLARFEAVADRYREHRLEFTRKIGGQLHRPVFFLAKKFTTRDMQVDRFISKLSLRSYLGIYVSHPREPTEFDYLQALHQEQHLLSPGSGQDSFDEAEIADFLADRLRLRVSQRLSPGNFLLVAAVGLGSLAGAGLLAFLLQSVVRSTRCWLLVFYIGYYVASSGFVWMLLNNPKWTGIKDEQTEWVFPSQSLQHRAEGFMVGAIICGVSFCASLFFWLNQKLHNFWARRVFGLALFLATGYLYFTVEDWLAKKKQYKPTWDPGHGHHVGSLRQNQGHTV